MTYLWTNIRMVLGRIRSLLVRPYQVNNQVKEKTWLNMNSVPLYYSLQTLPLINRTLDVHVNTENNLLSVVFIQPNAGNVCNDRYPVFWPLCPLHTFLHSFLSQVLVGNK